MKQSHLPWNLTASQVLEAMNTPPETGLGQAEAARRLAEHGRNELVESGVRNPWHILATQFTEVMVIVLVVAAAISFFVGDLKDAVVILIIVILNAALGFSQEYRAERAMAALKQMVVPQVKVRRDGQVYEIPARELVSGDLFLLATGGAAPADGRLLESVNLHLQEAALTGESVPVEKTTEALAGEHAGVGNRRNMVFMGTAVTYGRGLGIVTATGMETELGHMAELIQTVKREPAPLQRRLEQLGRGLAVAALAIVSVVFVLGLLRGEDWRLMLQQPSAWP